MKGHYITVDSSFLRAENGTAEPISEIVTQGKIGCCRKYFFVVITSAHRCSLDSSLLTQSPIGYFEKFIDAISKPVGASFTVGWAFIPTRKDGGSGGTRTR